MSRLLLGSIRGLVWGLLSATSIIGRDHHESVGTDPWFGPIGWLVIGWTSGSGHVAQALVDNRSLDT